MFKIRETYACEALCSVSVDTELTSVYRHVDSQNFHLMISENMIQYIRVNWMFIWSGVYNNWNIQPVSIRWWIIKMEFTSGIVFAARRPCSTKYCCSSICRISGADNWRLWTYNTIGATEVCMSSFTVVTTGPLRLQLCPAVLQQLRYLCRERDGFVVFLSAVSL